MYEGEAKRCPKETGADLHAQTGRCPKMQSRTLREGGEGETLQGVRG